jgi:hypothetical protein
VNAGERLLELSPLVTGTALQHLAATTVGSGGSGITVADELIVRLGETDLSVAVRSEVYAQFAPSEILAALVPNLIVEIDDDANYTTS